MTPRIVISPAALFMPCTVVLPVELSISIVPREVIGALLFIVLALVSRTVPALIAPVPVGLLRVDVEELVMTTFSPAVIVAPSRPK